MIRGVREEPLNPATLVAAFEKAGNRFSRLLRLHYVNRLHVEVPLLSLSLQSLSHCLFRWLCFLHFSRPDLKEPSLKDNESVDIEGVFYIKYHGRCVGFVTVAEEARAAALSQWHCTDCDPRWRTTRVTPVATSLTAGPPWRSKAQAEKQPKGVRATPRDAEGHCWSKLIGQ